MASAVASSTASPTSSLNTSLLIPKSRSVCLYLVNSSSTCAVVPGVTTRGAPHGQSHRTDTKHPGARNAVVCGIRWDCPQHSVLVAGSSTKAWKFNTDRRYGTRSSRILVAQRSVQASQSGTNHCHSIPRVVETQVAGAMVRGGAGRAWCMSQRTVGEGIIWRDQALLLSHGNSAGVSQRFSRLAAVLMFSRRRSSRFPEHGVGASVAKPR